MYTHYHYCRTPCIHIIIIVGNPVYTLLLLLWDNLHTHCYYCRTPCIHIIIIVGHLLYTLVLLQDVFRDFCDSTGQLPKEKVADAVRCLGENPLQSEVTFINKNYWNAWSAL